MMGKQPLEEEFDFPQRLLGLSMEDPTPPLDSRFEGPKFIESLWVQNMCYFPFVLFYQGL